MLKFSTKKNLEFLFCKKLKNFFEIKYSKLINHSANMYQTCQVTTLLTDDHHLSNITKLRKNHTRARLRAHTFCNPMKFSLGRTF